MRRFLFIVAAVIIMAFIIVPIVNAALVSTFESDDGGWTILGDANAVWRSVNGNPGGFLRGDDLQKGIYWHFKSPDSWSGDWSEYIGTKLSFDLKLIDTGGVDPKKPGNVFRIYGIEGNYLVWAGPNPDKDWTHYEVALNADTFGVTNDYFNSIMSNVDYLRIRGEYSNGADKEGLDNVSIGAVPIPASIWFLAFGVIGLIGFRQRFQE